MTNDLLNSFLSQSTDLSILFRHLGNKTGVHAYLITGEKGAGKKTLAKLMASALLCSSDGSRPCGICKNCILAANEEHPDLIIIEQGNPIAPGIKKDRSTIPVEDIREMIRLCGVRSTEGNMHVVLIRDAEKMTVQAQNCLLKTLEEPPSDTCIILATDHMESLLSTVISRCRIIRIKPWEDAYLQKVLAEKGIEQKRILYTIRAAGGSIGRAIELAEDDQFWELQETVLKCFFRTTSRSDVIKISNDWKDRKQDADRVLMILESLISMLTEARFSSSKTIDLSRFPPQWQRFSAEAGIEKFTQLTESVTEARKQLQFSVNFQAVLERLIFSFIGEGNAWLQ